MENNPYNASVAAKYDALRKWGTPVPRRICEIGRIGPQSRALDLGCGTGNLTLALQNEQPAAHYFGLDLSPEMLAVAARKMPETPLVRADAGRLPFSDASLDCVTGAFFLHHMPDAARPRLFHEVFRVLRKGFFLIVSRSHEQMAQSLIGRMFPEVVELDKARFPAIGRIRDWMAAAGFRGVSAESIAGRKRRLDADVVSWMEKKPISTLDLIPPEAFQRGMERLRGLVRAAGPEDVEATPFTLVFGEKRQAVVAS